MIRRRTLLVGGGIGAFALLGGGYVVWTQVGSHVDGTFPLTLTDAEWRDRLTEEQFDVMRLGKTERQFASPLNDEKREGTYACAGCAQPVYSSETKFDSGSGWPSFYDAIEAGTATRPDPSLMGMLTEVHCANCGSHLGHIFEDGPEPTGERHCINGIALDFAAA